MQENVIRYSEAPENQLRLASNTASGQVAFLDVNNGYAYDDSGNQVGRWEIKDDKDTKCLSDFCADYALSMYAASGRHADPERSAAMLMNGRAQLMGLDDEEAIMMDLGPSDVHIPSAMPNFASGYKNFAPLADNILPPLLVEKQVNDYFQFGKEDAFQRALPNAMAGGAQVGEISPRLTNSQYSCIERALGGFVTTQVEANADVPLKIRQATTQRVMNALLLEREIRAQALLRTGSNWNTVTTLASGFQWNGGASSDPVKDIHTIIEASYGDITGILMPENVWHGFIRNPAVRAYYAYKNNTAAIPKASEMQAILELPPIYVAKMKYINSAGALTYVWGTDVVLFRQPDQLPPVTQDDVATAYTFRWMLSNAKDGVTSGGFTVREFFVQDRGSAGGNKVVVLHSDGEQFTSKWIGGLVQNAYQ